MYFVPAQHTEKMSRKLPTAMKWQQFALVVARSPFDVLDRMRYDRATFYREVDARIFEKFISECGIWSECTFAITRWSEDKGSLWTESMWSSGGGIRLAWPVPDELPQPVLTPYPADVPHYCLKCGSPLNLWRSASTRLPLIELGHIPVP
jgi:hypothetical protein